MYVLFTGNTGVGKSSVIEQISKKITGSVVFSDPFVDNPFLISTYNNSDKAFQSEMFFIKEFFKIHSTINTITDKPILQERSVYECANIFCKQFLLQKIIDENEYKLCDEFVSLISSNFRKPDIIIYLTASIQTIKKRIYERNRDFEKCFNEDIIELQSKLYNEWVYPFSERNRIKLYVINTSILGINDVSNIVFSNLY